MPFYPVPKHREEVHLSHILKKIHPLQRMFNSNSTSLYHKDDRKKLTVDCRLQILGSTWACNFKGIQSGPENCITIFKYEQCHRGLQCLAKVD